MVNFRKPLALQLMQNWLARILHFLRDNSGGGVSKLRRHGVAISMYHIDIIDN